MDKTMEASPVGPWRGRWGFSRNGADARWWADVGPGLLAGAV